MFVYENIDIFSLKWPYLELSKFKQPYLPAHIDILFNFSGFSILIDFFKLIEDWKPKL